jgi:hypothetical protein
MVAEQLPQPVAVLPKKETAPPATSATKKSSSAPAAPSGYAGNIAAKSSVKMTTVVPPSPSIADGSEEEPLAELSSDEEYLPFSQLSQQETTSAAKPTPPADNPVQPRLPPEKNVEQATLRQYHAPDKVHTEQQASQAQAAVGFIYVPKKKDREDTTLFEYVAPSHEERALKAQKGAAGSASHRTLSAEADAKTPLRPVDERDAKSSSSSSSTPESITLPRDANAPKKIEMPASPYNQEANIAIDSTAIAALTINPVVPMATTMVNTPVSAPPPPPLASKLQEIVDQIVRKMYTISRDGVTDTTFELERPPLLHGVKVTITTYEHAQKEMNITFSNVVTNRGQKLLEENLGALKADLEHKHGFVVHQINTTQADQVPSYVVDSKEQERQRDDRQQHQGSSHKDEEFASEQQPEDPSQRRRHPGFSR